MKWIMVCWFAFVIGVSPVWAADTPLGAEVTFSWDWMPPPMEVRVSTGDTFFTVELAENTTTYLDMQQATFSPLVAALTNGEEDALSFSLNGHPQTLPDYMWHNGGSGDFAGNHVSQLVMMLWRTPIDNNFVLELNTYFTGSAVPEPAGWSWVLLTLFGWPRQQRAVQ